MKPTREDVLISRVVDREEAPTDWRELDRLAAAHGDLWQELLYSLRQDAAVRAVVAPALTAADRSSLPEARPVRTRFLYPWVGWAAALLMAVLWIASTGWPGSVSIATEPVTAAPTGVDGADVLGELSRVVVRTRPTDDGKGVEVVYVRRVLERTVVRELYQITEDEYGMPVPTQVDLARFERPSSY